MQLRSVKRQSVVILFVSIVLFAGLWFYGYPAIISEIYGADVPASWSRSLLSMNLDEIHQTLGKPDEDASAKEYQTWLRKHWWGRQELKILIPHCCAADSKPSEIYYVMHVSGFYSPVIVRRIGLD